MTKGTRADWGGARPGAGRKKKVHKSLSGAKRTPLEYLLAIMNDPEADPLRRDRAAKTAAPYLHPKAGEIGKKEEAQAAAATAQAGTSWEELLNPVRAQ